MEFSQKLIALSRRGSHVLYVNAIMRLRHLFFAEEEKAYLKKLPSNRDDEGEFIAAEVGKLFGGSLKAKEEGAGGGGGEPVTL